MTYGLIIDLSVLFMGQMRIQTKPMSLILIVYKHICTMFRSSEKSQIHSALIAVIIWLD